MLDAVTPFITPDPPWLANLPLASRSWPLRLLVLLGPERMDTIGVPTVTIFVAEK